ncbi:Putative LOC100119682, partial [Caligus rogercresseyi]
MDRYRYSEEIRRGAAKFIRTHNLDGDLNESLSSLSIHDLLRLRRHEAGQQQQQQTYQNSQVLHNHHQHTHAQDASSTSPANPHAIYENIETYQRRRLRPFLLKGVLQEYFQVSFRKQGIPLEPSHPPI